METRSLPSGAVEQLPILGLLKKNFDQSLSTKDKKTLGRILFWMLCLGGGYWFYKSLPTLLGFMGQLYLFIAAAFGLICIALFSGTIVNLLQKFAKVFDFRSKRWSARFFKIETLHETLDDIKAVENEVSQNIGDVEGKRELFKTKATEEEDAATRKFEAVKRIVEEAGKLDEKAKAEREKGNTELANKLNRQANELRTDAQLSKIEGEESKRSALMYVQSSNQLGKILEVLRDNFSAVRIIFRMTKSSVWILEKKLETSRDIKEATEGIAQMLNFPNADAFRIAFEATQEELANNLGQVRNNLRMLSSSRLNEIQVTSSQQELTAFVQQLETSNLKKLNIEEMSDASYEFKQGEGDSSFKFLT